jgi:hypothetical protein
MSTNSRSGSGQPAGWGGEAPDGRRTAKERLSHHESSEIARPGEPSVERHALHDAVGDRIQPRQLEVTTHQVMTRIVSVPVGTA